MQLTKLNPHKIYQHSYDTEVRILPLNTGYRLMNEIVLILSRRKKSAFAIPTHDLHSVAFTDKNTTLLPLLNLFPKFSTKDSLLNVTEDGNSLLIEG